MIEVPDKFNWVNMDGIDIVKSQGITVEGLFNRLLNSIQQCRYSLLYNWYFAEVSIPPTPVELVFDGEKVSINESITVTEDDVVHIHSLEPEAKIEQLNVIENGTYTAEPPLSGYNPVVVSVESELELPTYTLYSENASRIVSFEHTLTPGDYTVVVATTVRLEIGSVSVEVDSVPRQLTELVTTAQGNLRGLAYANISVSEISTLSLLTGATASDSGIQMIVISGEYRVEFVGSAGNGGNSFSMPSGLLFISFKWGYWGSGETNPTTAMCFAEAGLEAPATPGGSATYYYGGTYAVKLIS